MRKNYADAPTVVPPADWDFVDGNHKAIKLTSGAFGAPGSFGPTALYDVSKYSSELIALRFRQLYDLDLAIVRLSSVFGPMDRQTAARGTKNLCNYVTNAAASASTLTIIVGQDPQT